MQKNLVSNKVNNNNSIANYPICSFRAHNGLLNSMKVLEFDENFLVTCGGID